jgi:hypothetical protein
MANERPLVEEVLDYAVFAPLGLALTLTQDLPSLVARGRRQIDEQFGVARFVGKMAAREARKRIDAFLATPEPETVVDVEELRERLDPPERIVRSSDHLAIEGYDSLAASQVVARLATLERSELAAIAEYERATRRRQTILSRIAQLEHDDE